MTLADLVKNSLGFVQKNSPAILTALGVVGVISTAVLAHRAGVQSTKALEVATMEGTFTLKDDRNITYAKEVLRHTWPFYIAPTLMGGATIACVIGANTINYRRQAAVISAFTLTEKAFQEYREKNIELNGKRQDQKVVDAVATEHGEVLKGNVMVVGPGKVPCVDAYTGRQFESTADTIKKAEIEFNRRCLHDNGCTLNEFYSILGIPTIPAGEAVGWNNDKPLEVKFSSYLVDDIPVLEMSFFRPPFPTYNSPW